MLFGMQDLYSQDVMTSLCTALTSLHVNLRHKVTSALIECLNSGRSCDLRAVTHFLKIQGQVVVKTVCDYASSTRNRPWDYKASQDSLATQLAQYGEDAGPFMGERISCHRSGDLRVETWLLVESMPLYRLFGAIFPINDQSSTTKAGVTFTSRPTDETLPLEMTLKDVRSMHQLLYGDSNAEVLSLQCHSQPMHDDDDSVIADIREALVVAKRCSDRVILADLGHTSNGPLALLRLLLQRVRSTFDPATPETLWLLECIVDLQQSIQLPGFWECFSNEPSCTAFIFDTLSYARSLDKTSTVALPVEGLKGLQRCLATLLQAPSSMRMASSMREMMVVTGLLPRLVQRLLQLEGVSREDDEHIGREMGMESLEDPLLEEKKLIAELELAKRADADNSGSRSAYWAKGTGYGTGKVSRIESSFDIQQKKMAKKAFKLQAKALSSQVESIVRILTAFVARPPIEVEDKGESEASSNVKRKGSRRKSKRKSRRVRETPLLSDRAVRLLSNPALLDVLRSKARTTALLDMIEDSGVYASVLEFIKALADNRALAPLLWDESGGVSVLQLLESAVGPMEIAQNGSVGGNVRDEEQVRLAARILEQFFATISALRAAHAFNVGGDGNAAQQEVAVKNAAEDSTKAYIDALRDHQFGETTVTTVKFHYSNANASNNIGADTVQRVVTEISSLSGNMPLHPSSSVFLRVDTSSVNCMQALITGPANTPYANGCFLFDVYCGPSYPRKPPLVNLATTGGGSVRFNPNLYANGKVCLSLLGTWGGASDEQWDEKTSTLLQVFVSIQALIFVEMPYFNEPSFEVLIGTPLGWMANKRYNDGLKPATVTFAMVDMIRHPPLGFEDVVRTHFSLKREEVLKQVGKWEKEQRYKRKRMRKAAAELRQLLSEL